LKINIPKKLNTLTMANMDPKHFIKTVLVDELGQLIPTHPYISFVMMGIGIEFLGKCLDSAHSDWNEPNRSAVNFKDAILKIPSLQRYGTYLVSHKLYSSFRCGLAHAVSPKLQVTLSSKNEMGHLVEHGSRINLKAEDFYADFKAACEYIISLNFPSGDKMNRAFLQVPGPWFNAGTDVKNGKTSSLA